MEFRDPHLGNISRFFCSFVANLIYYPHTNSQQPKTRED